MYRHRRPGGVGCLGWTDEAMARSGEQGTGVIMVIHLVLLHGNSAAPWLVFLAWLITLPPPDTKG